MVSSGKHRRSRVQRLSSAMICATDRRVRAREPRAAVGRRPSGGSRVVAAGRCGTAASHSSRSGLVTLARAVSRFCAARSGIGGDPEPVLRVLADAACDRAVVIGPPQQCRGVARLADLCRIRRKSTYADDRIMPTVAMCCYGKQPRKFLSWLPEARSRSRGIQVKPDDVGDLGDQLGFGGEFECLGAPGLDSVVAPHPPCRRRFSNAEPTAQKTMG